MINYMRPSHKCAHYHTISLTSNAISHLPQQHTLLHDYTQHKDSEMPTRFIVPLAAHTGPALCDETRLEQQALRT
jgi:hypothetical protein